MTATRHFNPRGETIPAEVKHEGYAGWRWESFLTRFEGQGKGKKKFAKSKFLYKKDGKVVVSLADYLKTYKFPTPDVITFQLGVNDTSGVVDANRDERIKKIIADAETMISAFKKDAPKAIFGVTYITTASDQDAFGKANKCRWTAWDKAKSVFYLNKAMQKYFAAKHPDIIMIPLTAGLDSEYNFAVSKEPASQHSKTIVLRHNNAVHPNHDGYRQLGDIYYAWLKNVLDKKVK
jgi:lysophospholipase L1-like esterase